MRRAAGRVAWLPLALVGGSLLGVGGCGTFGGGQGGVTPVGPTDPTQLARCKVAVDASSPLVTEWPASEKANLESLARAQAVAVEYSGCEMRIVDDCRLPGAYRWRATTLATDTVEIGNSDELYAKLPLGAMTLEGELARSGRLAVRTTVAGQLHLDAAADASTGGGPGCARATHVVRAISVGSFQLLSGGKASAGGGVGVAGGRTERSESVMRQAGSAAACESATAEAPHPQCASPIQLFLTPLHPAASGGRPAAAAATPDDEAAARRDGVRVVFAPPPEGERWTLRDYAGRELCELPCERWLRPNSGAYVQREPGSGDTSVEIVKLPDRYGAPAGSTVYGNYQAQRGSPLWSSLTFYGGGIPLAIGGIVLLSLGLFGDDCDRSEPGCDPTAFAGAPGIIGGSFYLAGSAAAMYWWLWSHPARFDVSRTPFALRPRLPALAVGPGFVAGTF